MKLWFIVLLVVANISTFAQRVGYSWVKTIDASLEPISIVDKENRLIVVTSGNISKFDLDGNLISETSDTLYNATGIAIDSENNLYLTGRNAEIIRYSPYSYTKTSYIYLAKYDDQGNRIWVSTTDIQTTNNSAGNFSTSIACDYLNGIYLTGSFTKSIAFDGYQLTDNNSSAIFIAKYDTIGNVQWAKKMHGTNLSDALTSGQGNEIVVDQENNIYVTGSYRGTFNFGGTIVSCHTIDDIFLTKLDINGTFLFTHTFGGDEADEGVRLIIDENNNLIMLAKFGDEISLNGIQYKAIENYNNAIIVKYENDSVDFATQIGYSNGGAIMSDICLDKNQNILYVGSIGNWSSLYPKIYRIGSSGEIDWDYYTTESPETNFAYNNSIVTDSTGGVYLVGTFNNTAYFGDIQLGTTGSLQQVFVGKVDTAEYSQSINNYESDMTILVYPTITNGGLTIISESLNLENSNLYLINTKGQIVKRFGLKGNNTEIHFENLSSGVYIVRIIGNGFIENSKIIKH